MRRERVALACALVLASALACVPACALEVAGVKLDDKVAVSDKELVLNGAGVRTRAIFKVYVAALYVPSRTSDAATVLAAMPRRIELRLLRTLSSDQLVDALNDGLKENNTEAERDAIKAQIGELAGIMHGLKQVKEGDAIALDFVEGATRILVDGSAKGTIAGEAFNRALFKVWLGEHPVQTDLKKAMLGG
jgi:long-chain acyl-CoA synthetase